MSTDPKLHFTGGVENGKLKLSNRKDFDLMLTQFEGKRIEGYIWRQRKRKSQDQLGYLFGYVYKIIADAFIDLGNEDTTVDDVHEWAKEKFLDRNEFIAISPITGEVTILRKSIKKFNTMQLSEFTDRVRKFAVEFFGIIIADPDPIWFVNKD